MQPQTEERDVIIPLIVIGLLVWGAMLALGAFLFRNQLDYRKPLIIMACVGAFVGFWGVLLWFNRGRLRLLQERKTNHRDTEAQRDKEQGKKEG